MKSEKLAHRLEDCLANTYALYIKTQNFHWNVEGPHFSALHVLFETQYTELAMAIDEIAERIRALGFKAPGSFKIYAEKSGIEDADVDATDKQMLQTLVEDHSRIVKVCYKALKVAQEQGDEATVDQMIERIRAHEKTIWMLKSSI